MKRILIIEDNIEIAELERDFLEASAIESVIETDGTKGLERALQEDFDLILLDIMLPGIDGFHICRRIREEKEVPILMVSASTPATWIMRYCTESGSCCFDTSLMTLRVLSILLATTAVVLPTAIESRRPATS